MTNVLIELSNVITFFNQRFLMTFINKERTTFLLLSDKPIFNFDLIRTFLVENQLNDFCTKEIDLIKSKIDIFLDTRTTYNQIPKNTNSDLNYYSYLVGNRTYINQLYDHIKYCSYIENTFKIPTKQNFENVINANVTNESIFFYNVSIGFMFLRMLELRDILNSNIIQLIDQPQQPKTTNIDEVKKEMHNNIFIGNSFEVWERYKDNKNLVFNDRTDLRLIFELMKIDNLIVDTVELKHYIKWLNKWFFNYNITELKNINLKTKPNIQRTNDYNDYKKATLKQP